MTSSQLYVRHSTSRQDFGINFNRHYLHMWLQEFIHGWSRNFLTAETSYITICIIVDDLTFAYHSSQLHKSFKDNLPSRFYVKIFGELKWFIVREILQVLVGIIVSHQLYVVKWISNYGITHRNVTFIPMSTGAYIR